MVCQEVAGSDKLLKISMIYMMKKRSNAKPKKLNIHMLVADERGMECE